MSLDADHMRLTNTKRAKVTVEDDFVTIEGFESEGTSCRDVAALAKVWAIGRLQQELMATLEKPGGGRSGIG